MEAETFPNFFYRGISSKSFISSDNFPKIDAFCFDKEIRQDGFREMSINWDYSEEALSVLFKQTKADGSIQFSAGAAKLDFAFLKQLTMQFVLLGKFSYEKRAVERNDFHGNLLFKPNENDSTKTKQEEAMIRNALALIASNFPVIKNPEIQGKT